MKRSQRHALVLLTLMAGCGGESLHLGNDDPEPGTGGTGTGTGGTAISAGGTGAGGGASVELPLSNWPDQDGCSSDPELAGLLGAWEGQLEDFFLMPVEAIRIVINGASATGICGSVTWGNLPPLEPATDPDAVYPPEPYWDMPGWGGSPSATVIPGVPYTIVSGGARLPELRLGVISTEPWRSWCALQTPVPDQLATTGWSCVSARSSTVDDDGHCLLVSATSSEPLPEMLCFGCHSHSAFCECNATECAPQLNQEPTFELSLSADGNALTGTYQEFVGAPVASGLRLYLERVATEP